MGRAALAGVLLGLLLPLLVPPSPLEGQLRRDPTVPHASGDPADRLLVGIGSALGWGAEFPVSGLEGRVFTPARLSVAYAFAPGAVFRIEGEAVRVADVKREAPSRIHLDESIDDGRTHDAGDVRLSTLFRVVGDAEGLSGGLDLSVKLPSSNESRGIGLNTTDFFGSLYGSWGGEGLRATAELGVGVLEAPLETFVQNDVLVYGGEVLYRPADGHVGLALGVAGRKNTRGVVPVGTEDRGRLQLSAEYRAGDWILDAGVAKGYGTRPDWSVEAGLARMFEP